MDVLMVVLRLIHIFAGIYWVGASLFLLIVLVPALRAVGPAGNSVMRGMLLKTPYGRLYGIAAGLTTLAGIIMYVRVSGTFNADWLTSGQGIILSIGAVAGLLATGHGGATLGGKTDRMKELAGEIEAQSEPTDAQKTEFDSLMDYLGKHGRISLILMIIAVVGMSAWRYNI